MLKHTNKDSNKGDQNTKTAKPGKEIGKKEHTEDKEKKEESNKHTVIDLQGHLQRSSSIYNTKPYNKPGQAQRGDAAAEAPAPNEEEQLNENMSAKTTKDEEKKPAANKSTKEKKGGKENGKGKKAGGGGGGGGGDMKAPDFENQKAVKGSDCEIKCKGNKVLFCHRDILSMWSPSCAELFLSEEAADEESVSIEFTEHAQDDVKLVLAICYPPNAQIDDKNVDKVLPIAKDLQMQEITTRCQEHLCKKKGRALGIQRLLTAQEYRMPELEEKVLAEMKSTSFAGGTEKSPVFKKLDPEICVKLLLHRLKYIEELMENVDTTQNVFDQKVLEFHKIFSDVNKAIMLESANAGSMRDAVLKRADDAVNELQKETPENLNPYSDPDGKKAKEEKENASKEEEENAAQENAEADDKKGDENNDADAEEDDNAKIDEGHSSNAEEKKVDDEEGTEKKKKKKKKKDK